MRKPKRLNITSMLLPIGSMTLIVAILVLSASCVTDPRKIRIDSIDANRIRTRRATGGENTHQR